MKKTIAMLGALLALFACNKQMTEPETGQEIKVDLKINRTDAFAGTKALVKDAWAEGDVVFVFFQGVAAPKYLEMKYNSGSWTATPKEGLVASDLGTSGTMSAVYLPYGSGSTVYESSGDFAFNNGTLYNNTWFLQAEKVPYTYDTELHGALDMVAPPVNTAGGILVHFDVSGFTSGKAYRLYNENVCGIWIGGVKADGTVYHNEGIMNVGLMGYEDGSMLSFSGVLAASAVGADVDYQFSVQNRTDNVLFTRDAGTHKLTEATYIGLGDLSDATKWNSNEYIYLGFDTSSGESLYWAKKNLGATSEKDYGKFYAWGETEGYALSGSFGSYTCSHDFSTVPTAAVDGSGNLMPEYDAAHVALKGLWRMPTKEEMALLVSETTQTFADWGHVDDGMEFKYATYGPLFLPFVGWIEGTTPNEQGRFGDYWSSTKYDINRAKYLRLYNDTTYPADANVDQYMNFGKAIRPVFSVLY